MLVKVLNAEDLQREFKKMNRDYFSLEGYQAILDLFEETESTTDLDVVAICCDFSEESAEDIRENYSNIETIAESDDNESLLDALNYYTYAVELDNGNILYQNF